MRKIHGGLFIMLSILFTACETILFDEDMKSVDPQENFEYLWNECDEKYAYFNVKEVDWNEVKVEYSDKLYAGMSEDSLFSVLGGMLEELRDDHANLVSNFNISFFGLEYQAQDNFDWRIIVENYISPDYYISGPFAHNFLANGAIGYVRLSSFRDEIEPESIDFILERYKETNGLILDLRENGGGAISNVFKILSRFVDAETLVYYSRIKSGTGHDDFTEAEGAIVEPYDGIRYSGEVIVLTDRGTYSSGSLLALASKAIPNMTLMGDTTGGGLGLPNGGQLPNGWTYRFSITQTLTLDGSPDYENGVPPDIQIDYNWSNLRQDDILDRAIEELL